MVNIKTAIKGGKFSTAKSNEYHTTALRILARLETDYGWDKMSLDPKHPRLAVNNEGVFLRNWDESLLGPMPDLTALIEENPPVAVDPDEPPIEPNPVIPQVPGQTVE